MVMHVFITFEHLKYAARQLQLPVNIFFKGIISTFNGFDLRVCISNVHFVQLRHNSVRKHFKPIQTEFKVRQFNYLSVCGVISKEKKKR